MSVGRQEKTRVRKRHTCGAADIWFIETCLLVMEDTPRRPACEVLGPKVRKEVLKRILPVFFSHPHPPLHRQECSDEVCHKCASPQIGEQPYLGPSATIYTLSWLIVSELRNVTDTADISV